MNNWRLLLLAIVAVLKPSGSFTERNLFDGHQECCDRRAIYSPDTKLYGNLRETHEDQHLSRERILENRRSDSRHGNSVVTWTERVSMERISTSEPTSRLTDHRFAREQERRHRSAPDVRENRDKRIASRFVQNRHDRVSVELRNREVIDSAPARSIRISPEVIRISRDKPNVDESRVSEIRKSMEFRNVRQPSTRLGVQRFGADRHTEDRETRNDVVGISRRSTEREESRIGSELNFRQNNIRASVRSERLDDRRQHRDLTVKEMVDRRDSRERNSEERRVTRENPKPENIERVRSNMARQERRMEYRQSAVRTFSSRDSENRRVREIRSLERNEASVAREAREFELRSTERRIRDVHNVRNSDNIRSDERLDERRAERDSTRLLRTRAISAHRETIPRRQEVRRTVSLSNIERFRHEQASRSRQDANEKPDTFNREVRRESRDKSLERITRNLDMRRTYRARDLTRDVRFNGADNRRQLDHADNRADRIEQRLNEARRIFERNVRQLDSVLRFDTRDIMETMRRERMSLNNGLRRSSNERMHADRTIETRDSRRDTRDIRNEINENRRDVRTEERESLRHIESRMRESERTVRDSRVTSIRAEKSQDERNVRARDTRNLGRQIRANDKEVRVENRDSRLIQPYSARLAMERNAANNFASEIRDDRSRNVGFFMTREKAQVFEKPEDQYSNNLCYIFYVLQGAYLCGLLIQMMTENSNKAKTRRFSSWFNSPKNLVKAH